MAIPIIEKPIKFNTRVNYYDAQASTPNRDLQQIDLTARVSYKPDKSKLHQIYSTLGPKYDTNVLNNVVNEIIRGVIAQYDAQQLISDRETISNQIRFGLQQRVSEYGILIDEFAISTIGFSPQYQKAVENKQIARQRALEAKYFVEQAIQEAKSIIIQAEADAESIKLIGEATKKNPSKTPPSH